MMKKELHTAVRGSFEVLSVKNNITTKIFLCILGFEKKAVL